MSKESEQLRQELEKTRNEFEEFAYIVAHDLNAPLRAVSNLSTWIVEDMQDVDESVAGNVAVLQNRVERMKGMMDALLEYTRVNRLYLDSEETDVNELVDEILQQFKLNTQKVMVTGKAKLFLTYKKKLKTVLNHIITNAFQFHDKPDGVVNITISEKPGYVIVRICDNGPGIPESEQNKVFKLFYTMQSKDEMDTTGAGLTLSRRILEFIGGNIILESELTKGSCFTIEWPIQIK